MPSLQPTPAPVPMVSNGGCSSFHRRRLRQNVSSSSSSSSVPMRSATTSMSALALLLTAAVSLDSVHASLCSEAQQRELGSFAESNKPLLQACFSDLKLPVSTSSSWTTFISDEYLQDAGSAKICASDNCVKALIVAMENLPDCCSTASTTTSSTRNVPRLADDILHQCDVRDAQSLASELEAEIAKLPDLKVQIKSLGPSTTGSSSSGGPAAGGGGEGAGGASPSMTGGVDLIIDVKKRELMKAGGLMLSPNDSATNAMGTATSSGGVSSLLPPTTASVLIAVACAVLHLVV